MDHWRQMDGLLDTCLQRILSDGEALEAVLADYPALAGELRPRLEAALWLQQRSAALAARPGFLAARRRDLLAQLAGDKKKTLVPAPQSEILRLAAAAFLFALVLLVGNGLLVAAGGALPGQGLYPVRAFSEYLRLAWVSDPAHEAALQLDYAQQYLLDYANLVSRGDYESARVALRNHDRYFLGVSRILQTSADPANVRLVSLAREFTHRLAQDVALIGLLPTPQY